MTGPRAAMVMQSLAVLLAMLVEPAAGQTPTMIANGNYCSNRGGVAGNSLHSVNVGGSQQAACAQLVAENGACSNYYSYGFVDGWCDCVPCDGTSCDLVADPGYDAYLLDTTYQACVAMAAASVVKEPSSHYMEESVPTKLELRMTLTSKLLADGTITISANYNVWAGAAPMSSNCVVTIDAVQDDNIFLNGMITDLSTFYATVQTGFQIAAGAQVVFACTSNIAPLAPAGTTVEFTFTSSTDTVDNKITAWTTTATQMSATQITLSPTDYFEGTIPVQLTMALTSVRSMSAGDQIRVQADSTVWQNNAPVTCTVIINGLVDTDTFSTSALDLQTFAADVQTGKTVAGTSTINFLCTDNFAPLPIAPTVVTFSFVSDADGLPVTGVTGWQTVPSTQLMSTSVTLTPIFYIENTIPESIVFKATTTNGLIDGDVVTVSATYPIWASAGPVLCLVLLDGVVGTSPFGTTGGTATTDTSTFVATVQSGKSVGGGVQLEFTCSDNFAPLAGAGNSVSFTFTSSKDVTPVPDVTGWNTRAATAMGSPSVVLTPSSHYTELTTPDSIRFEVTTNEPLGAGDKVTIASAGAAVWLATGSVTCSLKKNGLDDTATFAGGTQATDTSTLVATIQTGNSIATSATIELTCSSNLAPLAASGTTVTFSFNSEADTIPVTGVTGWTTTPQSTVTSASVSALPATHTTGFIPSQIQFTFTTTNGLTVGDTVTITADYNIWSNTVGVACSNTQDGLPDPNTFASGTQATSLTTFVATVQPGGSVNPGTTLVFTCTNNLAAFAPASTVVTFQFVTFTDVIPATGIVGWTATVETMLAATQVSLHPFSYIEWSQPVQIDFKVVLTKELAPGDAVTIEADYPIWKDAGVMGCVVLVEGATDLTTFGDLGITALSTQTFQATVQPFQGVAAGDEIVFFCTENLDFLGPAGTVVNFDFSTSADNIPVQSVVGWTVIAATEAHIQGDPLTYYGSTKVPFVLPLDALTLLLETPRMRVLAAPFEGKNRSNQEQWIGQVLITTVDNQREEVLRVDIRNDIAFFNRTAIAPDAFETISAVMPWHLPYPLPTMPPRDALFTGPAGIQLLFGVARSRSAHLDDTVPRREVVAVNDGHVTVLIFSSSAAEYHGLRDFAAYEYAHLDIDIFDLPPQNVVASFKGALPELWGLRPLSEHVASMMKPEAICMYNSTLC
eukprot:TRINITY_DN76572_c0_g1_i1.p1 TRINITY_DN76572_c0_g1~~TRINITY_DN76572_c0_g1_i1.p1  ORF type:complete len:1189 (+),score=190.04 TRINITY_DN76572_c0_g1_i1:44-3610(+)